MILIMRWSSSWHWRWWWWGWGSQIHWWLFEKENGDTLDEAKADNDDENCSGQMIVSTTIEQDDENENVDRWRCRQFHFKTVLLFRAALKLHAANLSARVTLPNTVKWTRNTAIQIYLHSLKSQHTVYQQPGPVRFSLQRHYEAAGKGNTALIKLLHYTTVHNYLTALS